jgi:phage head maturation protease
MTITLAGMLTTADGTAMHYSASGAVVDIHAMDVDDLTVAPDVPIDLDHSGDHIGQLVHVERRDDGAVMAVGVVEDCDDLLDLAADHDMYWSGEYLSYTPDGVGAWIGHRPTLISAGVTFNPATVGLWPLAVLPGDVSKRYQRESWPWNIRSRDYVKRAGDVDRLELRHSGLHLHDQRARRAELDSRTLARAPLELRSAPTLDVHEHRRVIEVLAAPLNDEAAVIIGGRVVGERFARGCFAGDEHRVDRVKANRDHSPERTVGKAVRIDPYSALGCVAELRIAKTLLGDETLALAEDKVLDCSVGFRVKPGGETWDAQRTRRQVTKGELDHIALVPDPAYTAANILSVRNHR